VVSENQRAKLLTALIEYYRGLCPRIGGVKLYLLLASDLGKEVTHGRDAFLKFYAEKNFRLPRNKPIHTTNSNHVYRKYPNLVKGLEVRHVNHVWVADITYVWIEGDVLYLHLLTDAFSHAVIGWCLTETLEADGTVKALEMGIKTAGGGNLCATIHHSDRGTQYACYRYVDTLVWHHIRISMTECYKPTDNAVAERMNGILKTEWIYHQELFHDRQEAEDGIARMIQFYNEIRPHMSIGMITPMEVYRGAEPGKNLWRKEKYADN
jgi:transposase InsO family protein